VVLSNAATIECCADRRRCRKLRETADARQGE